MAERIDAVVVGAGVVGLACARALAKAGREVLVVEAAETIGTEVSSRNSEVIHAGIYYPTGSLKARHCLEGRERLYRYCERHGIGHRRLGKLIVATSEEQRDALGRIRRQAEANGVDDLRPLERDEVRALEPELDAAAALLSPSTGIVDSHALMLALQGEAESCGAVVAFRSRIEGGRAGEGGVVLEVGDTDGGRFALEARCVVNAAGLGAQALARSIAGVPEATVPPLHYARGCYFTMAGRAPFGRLVYPVPEEGGLGVHVTLDLAGQCRFGPDVEWIDAVDYTVDPARAERFYPVIRRYWPGLPDGILEPGYAGVRPKVAGPGEPAGDFTVHGPEVHGIPGLVNLYGIESPGLTASLSLADEACRRTGTEPAGG